MKREQLIKRRGDSITDAATNMNESDNKLHSRIAMAAYELYEHRGRIDGQDLQDWFKAEAIINGRTG